MKTNIVLAHTGETDEHHDMMGWNGWGMMSGFGWISMILFWGLIVLGIVALVKYISCQNKSKK